MSIPPINDVSPPRTDDEDEDRIRDAIRRSRNNSSSKIPFGKDEREERDHVKSSRKKAIESENPDLEDIDTIAENESNADAPVYNTRDKGNPQEQFQSKSQPQASFVAPPKQAAAPQQTNQPTLAPFAQFVQQKKGSSPTGASDSPFAIYKNIATTKKSASKVDSNQASIKEASADASLFEGIDISDESENQTGDSNLAQQDSSTPFMESSPDAPKELKPSPAAPKELKPSPAVPKELKPSPSPNIEQENAIKMQQQAQNSRSLEGKVVKAPDKAAPKGKMLASAPANKAEKKAQSEQGEKSPASNLNLFASGAQIGLAEIGTDKQEASQVSSSNQLQQLIEQLVQELHNVEHQGYTDTIIILNQPPMFQDARVVITSFDSATKEFNLSFENLTGAAKKTLDLNMHSLRETLAKNGYAQAIHIITTTTLIEHHLPQDKERTKKDPEGRSQQQKKQNNPNEEEVDFDI